MTATRKLLADFARTVGSTAGAPPAAGDEPEPRVPGYLVRERIGRGAHAAVYRVRSIDGDDFALKVLAPGAAAATAEAAAAARHPNVVAVHAHGVADGRPYLVTELCRGGTLAARLDAPADARRAADILRQLAGGLAAIHGAGAGGYVHRDLSENNVLFDGNDTPKIADFGLAKPVAEPARRTVTGRVVGTPGTIAPERFPRGDADRTDRTDRRSDIYSLGALGYAMLAGTLPFGPTGPGPYPPPVPLRRLRPDVGRGLAAVVHRCLDPAPGFRYQTADALARDLAGFLGGGWLVRTRVVQLGVRAARHLRRYWPRYALLGLAAGWGVYQDGVARREAAAADTERALRVEVSRLLAAETAVAARERELREDASRGYAAAAAANRDLIDLTEVLSPYQGRSADGRKLFDRVREQLSALAGAAERDPARAGEAADLYRRSGKLAFTLSDLPRAAGDYDAARRLAEAARAADDTPANRHRLAMVLREWGVTRAVRLQYGPAKAAWDEALRLLEPLAPTGAEHRFTLAQLHMVRANVAAAAGKREEYAAAERLIEELLQEAPGDRRFRFTLAEILNNRAFLAGGDPAQLEKDGLRAVAIRRELVTEQPERPEQKAYLAASLNHLGNALRGRGPDRFPEAEAAYQEAKGIYQSLVFVFPGVPSNRDELRQVETNLRRLAATRKVEP